MRSFLTFPAVFVVVGNAIILISLTLLSDSLQIWGGLVGIVVCLSSLLPLVQPKGRQQEGGTEQDEADLLEERRAEFEAWLEERTQFLKREEDRLVERQRELTAQLSRFHEFMEYPGAQEADLIATDDQLRLSEQDREVHALLESEAQRVYQKIRDNGYVQNDKVDVVRIRQEAFELIRKVARIYNPSSTNPLLETSVEQLARSASRICLHALVLLEQLPIDVKQFTINELHNYFRKAVQSYGTYKEVAPWLKRLSRGAYIGRLAAGANPVTLGAWWLATEVGRRGAQKFVENVVDRKAVEALNAIVTIVGVEVANIYGPGFRQRDPAWVYGTELTDLLCRFPVSRDSLREGLQVITSLPLRSEYDRVYLYRCVADHRAAGMLIDDSALLPRSEREAIASSLEQFFTTHLHGITQDERNAWVQDVEARLDLKLKLDGSSAPQPTAQKVKSALASVHSFLITIGNVPAEMSLQSVGRTSLAQQIPDNTRAELLNALREDVSGVGFDPPDLDPSSEITDLFLNALMLTSAECGVCDENTEMLLLETAGYFRRSPDEARGMLDAAYRHVLSSRSADSVSWKKMAAPVLRPLLGEVRGDETIEAAYRRVSLEHGAEAEEHPEAVLVVLQSPAGRRCVLYNRDDRLWSSDDSLIINRKQGYLVDDCQLTGGTWENGAAIADSILLSGSLLDGGYQRLFGPLLAVK